jgi:succinoglycan biosynthesis transport protein ExoP
MNSRDYSSPSFDPRDAGSEQSSTGEVDHWRPINGPGGLTRYVPALPAGGRGPREDEIDPRRAWSTLRRNWFLVLACFAACVAAGFAVLSVIRPEYEASATLQIEQRSLNVPGLSDLQRPAAESVDKGEISTEMEVLRSRALAEEVVDSLGLQLEVLAPARMPRSQIVTGVSVPSETEGVELRLVRQSDGRFRALSLPDSAPLGVAASKTWAALGNVAVQLAPDAEEHSEIILAARPRIAAADLMRRDLEVTRAAADADVIRVRYRSTDPELTRDVPNILLRRFIARRRMVQHTGPRGAVSLLRAQLDTVMGQLRAAEDSLRSFSESQQVIDLETQASNQVTQFATLRAQRDEIVGERLALTRALAELRAAEGRGPDDPPPYRKLLAFPTLLETPPAQLLLSALTETENERRELLIRRTPEDPDVRALTSRIHELEGQVQSMVATYLNGLAKQTSAIDQTLAAYSAELQQVPAKSVQMARFDRSTEVLSSIANALEIRLKEAEIAESAEDSGVQVLDWAILPGGPIWPKPGMILAIAALVGLTLGFSAAFGREWLDATVHTREDVVAAAGVPVLGSIPHVRRIARLRFRPPRRVNGKTVGMHKLIARSMRGPASEAYRTLRTQLTLGQPDSQTRMLVFTSSGVGDGKTTSLSNLAVSMAQQGFNVLLVDADMRRGALHVIFRVPISPGLSDVLLERVPLDGAIRAVDLSADQNLRRVVDVEQGGLSLLASGTLPPNPSELLASAATTRLLQQLAESYDAVLIDTPPVGLFSDAVLLGARAEGVILVARAGKTQRSELTDAVEQLRSMRVPLQGVVLNDFDVKREPHYGRTYRQYDSYATPHAR